MKEFNVTAVIWQEDEVDVSKCLELHQTKLPKFTEVEQRVINGSEFDIVARYGEHYWIAEVKP